MSLASRVQVVCDLGARLGADITGCWGWGVPEADNRRAREAAHRIGFRRVRFDGRLIDVCPRCAELIAKIRGVAQATVSRETDPAVIRQAMAS